MKFTPRLPQGNVNVSKTHPLIEFFWLSAGLLGIALFFYLVLGFVVDWAVEVIPAPAERWLGEQAVSQFPGSPSPELQQRLEALLTGVQIDSALQGYPFEVRVMESPEINAVALPGGHIVVFSGLLEQVESENELSMVLAHELGHYAHRDHLRRLGRGFGVAVASILFLGKDNAFSDFVSRSFLTFESSYSRQQESAADAYGLTLLVTRFGHAGGASNFFRRMQDRSGSKIAYLFASHPHPDDRIADLEALIRQNGYPLGDVVPLAEELRGLSAEKKSGEQI